MRSWFLCGVLSAGGCGGSSMAEQTEQPPPPPPPPPPASLTRYDAEPAGANCPYGGTVIRTGLDRNADGVVQDSEVVRTDYVCNAATSTLIRKDPLAPSLDCPDGGFAV
ncbi:MAG: hypothetical protein ABIY55_23805, partial [Kofleriaceae bacterium]